MINSTETNADIIFFEQYRETAVWTTDGILLRYPQPGDRLPEMPKIRKQEVDLTNFEYLGFQNTRRFEYRCYFNKTVGFFRTDGGFEYVCEKPWKYVKQLRQYKQVLSPDLSCYTDMPLIEQWMNVFRSRLIGAYWQYYGLTVIPTVTWSDEQSYYICFSGIDYGSIIAVSTIGTKKVAQEKFMNGFKDLCYRIKPDKVICYCLPIPDMYKYADIIKVEHEGTVAKRIAKRRPIRGQLTISNW